MAVLTCTHNRCFEQKNREEYQSFSAEKAKLISVYYGQVFVMSFFFSKHQLISITSLNFMLCLIVSHYSVLLTINHKETSNVLNEGLVVTIFPHFKQFSQAD